MIKKVRLFQQGSTLSVFQCNCRKLCPHFVTFVEIFLPLKLKMRALLVARGYLTHKRTQACPLQDSNIPHL